MTDRPGIASDTTSEGRDCPSGLCSVGLMKSFCPSCLIVGLLALPFELAYRGVARLMRKRTQSGDTKRWIEVADSPVTDR